MKWLLISICIFLVSCSTEPNLEKDVFTISTNLSDVYYLKGAIDYDRYKHFMSNKRNINTLLLDSPGGVFEYSKHIAMVIRRNQITTIVVNNCYSTCTLLFQAGTKRIVDPSAKFLYHGLRYPIKQYLRECPEFTKICEDRFNDMKYYIIGKTLEFFFLNRQYGIDDEIYNRLKRQSIDPNWLQDGNLVGYKDLHISAQEALKYNVATQIKKIRVR